ncbi:TolB-like translocation protein [Caldinitratiruptor microaerophilus]|nr:hypothetical protein [Caldinitratiruptor microaerophilus]
MPHLGRRLTVATTVMLGLLATVACSPPASPGSPGVHGSQELARTDDQIVPPGLTGSLVVEALPDLAGARHYRIRPLPNGYPALALSADGRRLAMQFARFDLQAESDALSWAELQDGATARPVPGRSGFIPVGWVDEDTLTVMAPGEDWRASAWHRIDVETGLDERPPIHATGGTGQAPRATFHSPTGTQVLIVRPDFRAEVLDIARWELRPLRTTPPRDRELHVVGASWSGDERRAAFVLRGPEDGSAVLWLVDLAGGAVQAVGRPGRSFATPRWAPNGRHLAVGVGDGRGPGYFLYSGVADWMAVQRVAVLDPEGAEQAVFKSDPGWLLTDWLWSPQVDRLLLICHSDMGRRDPEGLPVLGPAQLLEWNWREGGVRALGRLGQAYGVSYAPDGRTVVVFGESEGEQPTIRIVGDQGHEKIISGLSSVTALEQVFTPRVGEGILLAARDRRGAPAGLRLLLPDGRVLDTGVPGAVMQVLEGPGWVGVTASHGVDTSLHVFVQDSR